MDHKIMCLLKSAVQPQKMLNQDSIIKSLMGTLLPMITLALFFLQIGLDKKSIGLSDKGKIAISCILGALSAIVFILIAAGIIKIFALITKTNVPYTDLIFAIGFIFEIPFVINLIGVICNLVLGKNTSLSFGITGLLMMILPMFYLIMSINLLGTKYRKYFAVILSTFICALGLTGWTLFIHI